MTWLEVAQRVTGTGERSVGNSTQTALGSSGVFVGEWEYNEYEHVAIDVVSDAQGTLYIEFGIVRDGVDVSGPITDSDVIQALSSPRVVYANAAYFRSLVKMSGRAFRVRYVNDSVAQTSFAILSSYGNNSFPSSASDDNEILTTVTEREKNLYVAYGAQNVSGNGHLIFIDLSNTSAYHHDRTGRIDLSATYFQVDRAQNSTGVVRVGVITSINGSSASVAYVQGVRFGKSDDLHIGRDRNFSPSQLKLGVSGGALRWAVAPITSGITGINTGASLSTSAGGTAIPAVGDVILSWEQSTASYDFSVSAFFHGEASA